MPLEIAKGDPLGGSEMTQMLLVLVTIGMAPAISAATPGIEEANKTVETSIALASDLQPGMMMSLKNDRSKDVSPEGGPLPFTKYDSSKREVSYSFYPGVDGSEGCRMSLDNISPEDAQYYDGKPHLALTSNKKFRIVRVVDSDDRPQVILKSDDLPYSQLTISGPGSYFFVLHCIQDMMDFPAKHKTVIKWNQVELLPGDGAGGTAR
jgi:hypothetical protein